ncbi:hypothetical protein M1403_04000 [Patescibacteria group bacterium]|nr:hypothetical protein [Patescibacteria group bacterium]
MPYSLPPYKIVQTQVKIVVPATPSASPATGSAIPQLIFPPVLTATPAPSIPSATPPAAIISTPSAVSTPTAQMITPVSSPAALPDITSAVASQINNIPNPVVKSLASGALSIIRPPLLLFSRLLPGQYYQSATLPLPYTLLLLGLATGLVSAGLLLIRP